MLIDQEGWSLSVCERQARACDLMLDATDAAFMPAQAIAAHHKRDAPGSARTRLRGLAHLPDELGPQLDLLLHSTWPAGRTAPEPPFLPGLHARPRWAPLRHARKTQRKVSLASYRGIPTTLHLSNEVLERQDGQVVACGAAVAVGSFPASAAI